MKKLLFYFRICMLVLSISGCEKILDVDLNQTDPRLVVEAVVTDEDYAWVKLSKTSNYYDVAAPAMVSNAVVVIADNAGNADTLDLTADGYYRSSSMKGVPARNYFLRIVFEGREYQAQTHLAPLMPIDSLAYKYYSSEDAFHKIGYYPLFFFYGSPGH